MSNFNTRIHRFNAFANKRLLYLYIFPSWIYYQFVRFKSFHLPAFKRCSSQEKKNSIIIIIELFVYTIRFKCLPFFYFHYGFYQKKYNKQNILKYIPETTFYYKIITQTNQNIVLLDDKVIFNSICTASRLNIPYCFLIIKNKLCINGNNQTIIKESKEFASLLSSLLIKEVIVKPAKYSSSGDQIFILIMKENNLYFQNGNLFSYANLLDLGQKGDWIFEEKIESHTSLKVFNEQSLNCIRTLTYVDKLNNVHVLYAVFKFGNKSITDNIHQGGYYIGVNLDNGTLFQECSNEKFEKYSFHPSNQLKFSDFKIPFFNEVINLSRNAALRFSDCKIVGWDIGVSNNGVYLIEGNSNPGIDLIQETHNGLFALKKLLNKDGVL